MQYDVFISYSRKDMAVADQIAKAFDAAGISYFIGRQEMDGGLESSKVLATAIKESTVFLFLASKNSYESKYTRNEVAYVFNKKEDPQIIPYIIDGSTLPDELELTFSSFKCRDMRQHSIQTVVEDVLEKIGQKSDSRYSSAPALQPIPDSKIASRKRKLWPWLVAVCAVLAVALLVILAMRGCGGAKPNKGDGGNEDEGKPFQNETFTVNGVSFTMVAVEGGTFTMGCTGEQGDDCFSNEKPAHQVTVGGFCIGETEVTQALWRAVTGSKPSYFKGDNLPVETVSWDACQKFIKKLNELTGKKFRLPTEAEWEYAARGGNQRQGYKYSGSKDIGPVAWFWDNSNESTHQVKGKGANELGLYDMSGNVCEWCSDWYGEYSSSAQTDPQGPDEGSLRVARGGSWGGDAGDCRVSGRSHYYPVCRGNFLGFRLVLVP